jgi:hypothetical protein
MKSKMLNKIPENHFSFYNFARDYVMIKNGDSTRKFNEFELCRCAMFQDVIDKRYALKFVHLRGGSRIFYETEK